MTTTARAFLLLAFAGCSNRQLIGNDQSNSQSVTCGAGQEALSDGTCIATDHGPAGSRANGDPCAGVVCNTPPPSECRDNILTTYASPGTCTGGNDDEGSCSYSYTTVNCPYGCANGACNTTPTNACGSSDPCAGVVCVPKPTTCQADSTLVVNSAHCDAATGKCRYEDKTFTCQQCGNNLYTDVNYCEGATDDVCTGFTCDTPPPSACISPTAFLKWDQTSVTCVPSVYNDGRSVVTFPSCPYHSTIMSCPGGCVNGVCNTTTPCPDADNDGFCDSFDVCPGMPDFRDGVYCDPQYDCQSNADCPPTAGTNYWCQKVTQSGGSRCQGIGTCKAIDHTPCPLDFNPVCGCNGTTYSNNCYAAAGGANWELNGLCSGSPCNPLDSCQRTDLYCASSDFNTPGTCEPVPTCCPAGGPPVCAHFVYDPVTHLSGDKTFDNECKAHMAGLSVKSAGPCP
jgi:hypothetical protein